MTLVVLFLLLAQTSVPRGDFQTQFVTGLKALNEQNLAAAEASLRNASRLQPANPRVWTALAQTYRKLHKTALAADAAAKAERLGASDPVALGTLATYYAEQGKFAKAGDLESACIAKDPSAAARAATDYIQADQPKKAIALVTASLGWQQSAALHNLLGKAYEADGQILKTIPELQEAIALRPDDESYCFDLIQVLLNHYNFDTAVQVAESGRLRFPRSAQMALASGVARFGLNQTDIAIDAFLTAADLAPDIEQPYAFLARLITAAPDRLPAILQRTITYEIAQPKSYVGYFLHAKILIAQGENPTLTEELLRKSILIDSQYWEAHLNLGIVLATQGLFPEAEKEFRRSVELNPKDPAAHYRLFRALSAQGKVQAADAELALQRRLADEYQRNLDAATGQVKRLVFAPAH